MTPQIETAMVSSENNRSEENRQNLLLDFPQAFKSNGVLNPENLHQVGDEGMIFSTGKDWPEGQLILNLDIDPRNPSCGLAYREDLRKPGNSIYIETNGNKKSTEISVINNNGEHIVCISNLAEGIAAVYPLEQRDPLAYSFGVTSQESTFYKDLETYNNAKAFLEESLGYSLERFVIEYDTDFSQPSQNGIQMSGDLRIIMDLE